MTVMSSAFYPMLKHSFKKTLRSHWKQLRKYALLRKNSLVDKLIVSFYFRIEFISIICLPEIQIFTGYKSENKAHYTFLRKWIKQNNVFLTTTTTTKNMVCIYLWKMHQASQIGTSDFMPFILWNIKQTVSEQAVGGLSEATACLTF